MTERVELAHNAAGRAVPSMVNNKPQIPYLGIGKYQPRVRKQAPPVRSTKDYPENGDKRLPDLETALRKCGLRDGMIVDFLRKDQPASSSFCGNGPLNFALSSPSP